MNTASRFIYVPDFVHDGVVEKEAFMPSPNIQPYETSVILHGSEGVDWAVGRKIGAQRKQPRQVIGAADITEGMAISANLYIEPQPSSISRNHALLKGWDKNDKMSRLAQAELLALRAQYMVAPD